MLTVRRKPFVVVESFVEIHNVSEFPLGGGTLEHGRMQILLGLFLLRRCGVLVFASCFPAGNTQQRNIRGEGHHRQRDVPGLGWLGWHTHTQNNVTLTNISHPSTSLSA